MKRTVFGLLIIIVLIISVSFIRKKNDEEPLFKKNVIKKRVVSKANSVAVTNPALQKTQKKLKKKYFDTDSVPWDELQNMWAQRLEEYLLQTGYDRESNQLNKYLQAKKKLSDDIQITVTKLQLTYSYDPVEEKITLEDAVRYRQLQKELIEIKNSYRMEVKLIFGREYASVSKLYHDFMKSAEAYNNNEHEIGLDIAF